MSIEYSLKIKEHKLTIDNIETIMKELFNKDDNTTKSNCSMTSTFEKLGFKMDLMDARKFPYNIWDSNILNEEFEYSQVLIFSINKQFYDFEILYNNLYKIVFTLVKKINLESLFVSSEEICYFKNNSDVIINKNEYIWENQDNKKLLNDWNVQFVDND